MSRTLRIVALALAGGIGALLATHGAGVAPSGARAATGDEAAASVRVVAATTDDIGRRAAERVGTMSIREKAAAVVMGHIPTTDAAALREYMQSTGLSGFILMGANIPADEAQLRALTAALVVDPALAPLIAVDQEGGDVSRLPWDRFPSAVTLKHDDPAATQDAFAGRGALVQRAGITVNFGIVADVTDDPSSFIYRRALGTTPADGAARVGAAVAGEAGQALSTLKHFPGHGGLAGDSHSVIPTTTLPKDQWSSTIAAPFRAGIDAGAPLVMFGHLAYTAVDAAPASLSAHWHRILREELGFDGVAVTDDLGMLVSSGIPDYADPVANAVAALAAGNDLLLTVIHSDAGTAGRIIDGIVAAVESGAVPQERLDEAATRVIALRLEATASGRGLMPCADCTQAG